MTVSCHLSNSSSLGNSSPDEQVVLSSGLRGPTKGMFGGSNHFFSIDKRNPLGQTFCSAGVCTYGETVIETKSYSHAKEEKVGVLLLNLGGPDTLNDVQPFLFNLFADPVGYLITIILYLH